MWQLVLDGRQIEHLGVVIQMVAPERPRPNRLLTVPDRPPVQVPVQELLPVREKYRLALQGLELYPRRVRLDSRPPPEKHRDKTS